MLGPVGAATSQAYTSPQSQPSSQAPKPDATDQAAQPASQTPSSAEASQVVQSVPDNDNGRGADLQPQLNQQPQNPGTGGINEEAVQILEQAQQNTSSDEEFRAELSTQLEAAGLDANEPIVDIRV
ncbi:hypothetical protein KMP13_00525 [Epibacterium ulvae]|uniref:hypothetical protein n=1 Tax=Epibacterium ulvae TaxID=1156985 RepID=UPI001BFC6398|nr:hypothetical protein [Epibacterium ulvae]MBT8152405.1 hypothetical protein [Epibacterium ulvae]